MYNRNDMYGDYDYGDDMTAISSHCSHFSRRHDFDTFNMSTYQSCENCRHLSSDNECVVKAKNGMNRME